MRRHTRASAYPLTRRFHTASASAISVTESAPEANGVRRLATSETKASA